MPSSTILEFTDPDEYQVAMGRAEDHRSIITASGSYRSELTLVALHSVGLQDGKLALPRVVQAAGRIVAWLLWKLRGGAKPAEFLATAA